MVMDRTAIAAATATYGLSDGTASDAQPNDQWGNSRTSTAESVASRPR